MIRVVHLDNFGFLSIAGKDAVKFMQGYSTCDLADIGPGNSGIGAVCNLQGRMVASFRVATTEAGLLLRMDRALVPAVEEFLKKYIVFSKAEMLDVSGDVHCFGVFGEIDGVGSEPRTRLTGDVSEIVRVAPGRFEVWTRRADYEPEGAGTATADEWWQAEIADGMAWVSAATKEEFMPQMLAYHEIGGVDFDKGCYLGQEIVARMQYRGAVNRKLHRGNATGPVNVGDPVTTNDGKNVGLVVTTGGSRFLAVIQAKDDGTPACFVGDKPVEVERVTFA